MAAFPPDQFQSMRGSGPPNGLLAPVGASYYDYQEMAFYFMGESGDWMLTVALGPTPQPSIKAEAPRKTVTTPKPWDRKFA